MIENYIVVDIRQYQKKINEFRMLRNKALEEGSFETAQWIDGRITAIKEIIGNSNPLEDIVSKFFDYGDDDHPEPNEALKSAKEIYDKHIPPYVSDDFQIGPDGAYENVDEWDPDFMDGKNKDTWFDELDINPHWKKHLKKYNLSPEIWNVICRLYYGETIDLKKSLEEQRYWIDKYNNLKRNIKNLVD